ncbi:MAG: hypothetical protein JWQ72_3416, partial [Polaromonas sp.]|nr:hypothetical protein [Polaromonas sp.]
SAPAVALTAGYHAAFAGGALFALIAAALGACLMRNAAMPPGAAGQHG